MARPLRLEFPGAVYHLTSRGNARQRIFFSDNDRVIFLDTLSQVISRYSWICHAYCLMANHYHLLIETPKPNLSLGMRQLNGVYTQSFNRRHKRVGHLFQGRFKAILVQKESYLLELCRHIVLNPVRIKGDVRIDGLEVEQLPGHRRVSVSSRVLKHRLGAESVRQEPAYGAQAVPGICQRRISQSTLGGR